MHPITIIGTGLAGYTTAREFRKHDKQTPLRLVSADDGRFYSKPMLSNALARGQTPEALVNADAEAMAKQLQAEVLTGAWVGAIDTETRFITIGDRELPYSKLVLAMGAKPIRIALGGDGAEQVLAVNNLGDYAVFRAAIEGAKQVVVLGAGLIGCEFANDMRSADIDVDVVDLAPWPLGRLVPEAAGRALQGGLSELGVRWHLGTTVDRVDRHGEGLRVTLANGETLDADVVLSAVGLLPATLLAQDAGLEVNRGIVTDSFLRTSAAEVYALGDCAEVGGLVLPYVMPLMQAGRALAKTLSGTPTEVSYPAMPVVVKTPAQPLVVCPPLPGIEGEWEVSADDQGVRALFHQRDGGLVGFALSGGSVGEKTLLARQLPAWL